MKENALLIIDAQNGLIEGNDKNEPIYSRREVLNAMQKVLMEAREANFPVIYIQDLDVGERGTKDFEIHPSIAPEVNDFIIHKKYTDAFLDTNLHELLQTMAVKHLIIMGCKTEYCVDTTCRKAVTLGYDVTLVADAHSTTDNGILSADQIIAHHNKTLQGYDNIKAFVFPRTSAEDVLTHIHPQYRS